MSRTLIIQNGWLTDNAPKIKFSEKKKIFSNKNFSFRNASQEKKELFGRARLSLISWIFVFLIMIFLSGIVYLYQVNSLATKGFEIKELENKIKETEKENKQLQIKEIELRSMNNIEKSTEDLNLVNSSDITYLEVAGPMAMK